MRPHLLLWRKEALGAAIGCEFRASLAVLDQGLSGSIQKKLEQAGNKKWKRRDIKMATIREHELQRGFGKRIGKYRQR